jgi:hypothetical protein
MPNGAVGEAASRPRQLLLENRKLCYSAKSGNTKEPQFNGGKRQVAKQKNFFTWILCNPLKRPNSAKGIQGNPSTFIWICLDLLGD